MEVDLPCKIAISGTDCISRSMKCNKAESKMAQLYYLFFLRNPDVRLGRVLMPNLTLLFPSERSVIAESDQVIFLRKVQPYA